MGTAVELVPYDPNWPDDFGRIRDGLQRLLAPYVLTIAHIGSTSIPGLAAKPLIDIDIILRGLADIPAAARILLDQGYEPRGNRYDDEVWAFMRRDGRPPERLYLCTPGNRTHERRMIFQDYLRAHPADAAAYAKLKRELAETHRHDGDRYTAEKRHFVDAIIEKAVGTDLL
ncbi:MULTISPECIES: GrpB family protein [unclassified Rhizobium]|uniref:GrpB family protein n=1 Tax=unclassified Rhizobium TaxID=2613769 RepID=UPI000EAAAA0F|nr:MULTISPECIES: GrpB family protein [unclassified Rhizobium]AYG66822.1 GrpB family protein [Rhizobium sp. CCGE531]AYG73202.1 GrpB family protein [Rhizobium sp. CCGE532]